MPGDLYRPAVGILLLNPLGKAFVGQRIDTADAWQLPQGGIDAGEDPEAAAFRELREETGSRRRRSLPVRAAGSATTFRMRWPATCGGALPGAAAEVVRDAAHGPGIGNRHRPGR